MRSCLTSRCRPRASSVRGSFILQNETPPPDALAVRSVSLAVEVREGAVEESERSEGDDVGLRAFVGRRQAVVSTNDIKTDATELAERAVAMARAAPEDPFAGLADPARLARDVPDLDLLDPDLPSVGVLEERARRAESAALAVE